MDLHRLTSLTIRLLQVRETALGRSGQEGLVVYLLRIHAAR